MLWGIPLFPLSIQQDILSEIESYQKIVDAARMVVKNYKLKIEIDPEWKIKNMNGIEYINLKKTNDPEALFGDSDFEYIDISSVENETVKIDYGKVFKTKETLIRAR